VVVVHDFFLELVRAGIRVLHHLDDLGEFFSLTGLQGCHYFLCHGTALFVVNDYLISLCTVIFFRMGLNFFNSRRSVVFFLFLVVM